MIVSDIEKARAKQRSLEIQFEVACREAATEHGFTTFCKLMMAPPADENLDFQSATGYRDLPHLRLLSDKYVKISTKALMKLAVSMPPQHGKSWTGFLFLAWYIGRNPKHRTAFVTYSADFAREQFAHLARFLRHPTYKRIFPDVEFTKLNADEAETRQGGAIITATWQGGLTGKALDLIWVDDLYQGKEFGTKDEERIMYFFVSNLLGRIRSITKLVLIGTRWNEDDVIGKFADPNHPDYKGKPGHADQVDQWGLINIPAILDNQEIVDQLNLWVKPGERRYELGQALDPEMHPLDTGAMSLVQKRSMMGVVFSCQYQGRPTPDEGIQFKREWLRYHTPFDVRRGDTVYMSMDFGLTEKKKRDASAICVGLLDPEGRKLRVTNIYNERKGPHEMAKRAVDLMIEHNPRVVYTEKGQAWTFMEKALNDEMKKRGVYFYIVANNPGTSKEIRALPLKKLLLEGRMTFSEGAHWLTETEDQLMKFPNGSFDDIVDALSWLAFGTSSMLTMATPKEEVKHEERTPNAIVSAAFARQRVANQRKIKSLSRLGARRS